MSDIECISSEQWNLIYYEKDRARIAIARLNSVNTHRLVKLAIKCILEGLRLLKGE